MSLMNDALRKREREQENEPVAPGFSSDPPPKRKVGKKVLIVAGGAAVLLAAFFGFQLMQLETGGSLVTSPVERPESMADVSDKPAPTTPSAAKSAAPSDKGKATAQPVPAAPAKPVEVVESTTPSAPLGEEPSKPAPSPPAAPQKGFEPGPGRTQPPAKASVQAKPASRRSVAKSPKKAPVRRTTQSVRKKAAPKKATAQNAAPYYSKALAYHRAGRLADAMRLYRKVLAMAPGHPAAMLNLSSVYMQLGNYRQANDLLVQLEQTRPRPKGVLLNLSICAIGLGDPARALIDLQRAEAQSDAASWEIRFHRAVALARMGRFGEALNLYRQVEQNRPDDPQLQFNLAATLDALGRYEQALVHYEAAIKTTDKSLDSDRESITQRIRTLRRYLNATPTSSQTTTE